MSTLLSTHFHNIADRSTNHFWVIFVSFIEYFRYAANCVKFGSMLKHSSPRRSADLMEFTVRRAAKMVRVSRCLIPRRDHRIWLLHTSLVWSYVLLTTRKFEYPSLHSANQRACVKWRDGNLYLGLYAKRGNQSDKSHSNYADQSSGSCREEGVLDCEV